MGSTTVLADMETKTIYVRVPLALAEDLEILAKYNGLDRSGIIRMILMHYLRGSDDLEQAKAANES